MVFSRRNILVGPQTGQPYDRRLEVLAIWTTSDLAGAPVEICSSFCRQMTVHITKQQKTLRIFYKLLNIACLVEKRSSLAYDISWIADNTMKKICNSQENLQAGVNTDTVTMSM